MSWLRRIIRWTAVAGFAGMVLAIISGVVGEFFIELARERGWYDTPSETLDVAMSAFSAFVTQTWFLAATAFLAGIVLGLWADAFMRRREPPAIDPAPMRPDTRLRLRLDPSGTMHYLEESQSNIHGWQQTITSMKSTDTKGASSVLHIDTVSVVFERDIEYERPVIETFGHNLSAYNFFPLGTHGAVFQFFDAIQAPALEIWFPPPGYYAERQEVITGSGGSGAIGDSSGSYLSSANGR